MSEKGMLTFNKYRSLIIAIVIIIVIIIVDIILENYSKKSLENVSSKIEKIYETFEEESEDNYNVKELEKLSSSSIKYWEEKADFLSCFLEHDEVEKISTKLNLLNIEIKNEIWDDAKITTCEIKEFVKYLNIKHKFSLQNLF